MTIVLHALWHLNIDEIRAGVGLHVITPVVSGVTSIPVEGLLYQLALHPV